MPDIVSDSEALHKIEALFSEKCVTPFDDDYNSAIESLSFSRICFDGEERTEIKGAWTGFLREVFESDTSWEWPCNVGIAEWYAAHERPLHAIAVYEHLLKQIQRKGLDESEREYISEFQGWLQRLFQLCQRQRLTERALHVAGLIGDFHEQGFFGWAEYAEVIASIPTLQRHEASEIIEKEREEAVKRYRDEFGDLLTKLHPDTARCLIQAERVSVVTVRHTDPSAAPLCLALAMESEFHHKLHEGNRHHLERILGEKTSKPGKSCSIGQIHVLVKKVGEDRLKRPLIETAIPAWRRLLAVRDVVPVLQLVKEHRNQIAHVTELGPYTQVRCDEFVKKVRDSRWIIEFLTSLQPS